jgi:hypothetical protein
MGSQPCGEHAVPPLHRLLPERLREPPVVLVVWHVAAPSIRDEYVEATMLRRDPLEDRPHLVVVGVIADQGDTPTTSRRDLLGGVFHCMGELGYGRNPSTAPAGDIDRGSLSTKCGRDAAAGAPACAGNESHPIRKLRHDLQHAASAELPPRARITGRCRRAAGEPHRTFSAAGAWSEPSVADHACRPPRCL